MECFLCQNFYSETILPVMLSCGHTTCNGCLANLQRDRFPCPCCVRSIKHTFPNLSILSQQQIKARTNNDSICEVEEGLCHPSTKRCLDHNKEDSDPCIQLLRKELKSSLNDGTSVPTSEDMSTMDMKFVLPLLQPKRCTSHDLPYSLYNESHPGSHLLCEKCAVENAQLLSRCASTSIPLSTASLCQQKVQQTQALKDQLTARIETLTSSPNTFSDKSARFEMEDERETARLNSW